MALHLVVFPLTFVLTLGGPGVVAIAADVVFKELSSVRRPVRPDKLALPMLHSIKVGAFVARAIRPGLNSIAVLSVFDPLTFVDSSV